MRVLLDTTFLMPLFQLESSINFDNALLKKLLKRDDLQFLFQIVSLIEIKWMVIKGGKQTDEMRNHLEKAFSAALRFLEDHPNISPISIDVDTVNDVSYELEKFGNSDYFDTLILASAILEADILITEDESFPKLLNNQKIMNSMFYNPKLRILNWTEFVNEFNLN